MGPPEEQAGHGMGHPEAKSGRQKSLCCREIRYSRHCQTNTKVLWTATAGVAHSTWMGVAELRAQDRRTRPRKDRPIGSLNSRSCSVTLDARESMEKE